MAWPSNNINEFGQLQVQGSDATRGFVWRNTFAFWGHDAASPMTPTVLAAFLASAWADGLITAYRAIMQPETTLDGLLARQVADPQSPGDPKNEAFRSVLLPGTRNDAVNGPSEACPLLKLGTDQAGRSGHGHVFLPPPLRREFLNGDSWDFGGDYGTKVQAVATELGKLLYTAAGSHAGGGAADIDLVVFSRRRRAADLEPFAARCTSIARSSRVRWLRSRGPEA